MTRIVSTLFKVVNVLVVFLYLLACLIPFLPTGTFWMIAVLGLIFPILCFVVFAFFVGWAIARSRWMLVSLIALLVSFKQISVIFGLNSEKFTVAKTDSTLRVFTWNVSSWGETGKSSKYRQGYERSMIEFVEEQQADVLCFQEFFDIFREKKDRSAVKQLKELGYNYSYFVKTIYGDISYKTGVAIFSKYPIVDTAKFLFGERDFAEHLIYADIKYKDQMVRVFTTHLQSVRFDPEQYNSIRQIKSRDEEGLKGSRTVVSKLKKAYQYRGAQADFLHEKIKESPYPAIVCGDFNDVPNSYTYFKVRGDLQDAFLAKGNKLGRTFRYLSPTLRIDYILADKKLFVEQFNRIVVPYSDHYPVVADFNFGSTTK